MGPNFTVTPKILPYKEFITVTEIACQSLKPTDAEDLRAEISRILKQSRKPKTNLTKKFKAIKELKSDREQIILTADKGVALVVMDKNDYIRKMKELLDDSNMFKPLNTDPTMKQKNKLINILRRIKTEAKLEDAIYRRMYPTVASSPKLYGLPKIHKKNNPLRPIVSSRGSATYGVTKELAKILKPLTANTIHHVNISKEIAEEIKKNKLDKGECIISYDISALFTSIPVKSAIQIIKNKLEQDTELRKRTSMSTKNILELLEFCLCNTYFLFWGQFYEQTKVAAMGSPVSPVVVNFIHGVLSAQSP